MKPFRAPKCLGCPDLLDALTEIRRDSPRNWSAYLSLELRLVEISKNPLV